jgi:hypothetical protein
MNLILTHKGLRTEAAEMCPFIFMCWKRNPQYGEVGPSKDDWITKVCPHEEIKVIFARVC